MHGVHMRQLIVLLLVLVLGCMHAPASSVEQEEIVQLFLAMADDVDYAETRFSGEDALRDLVTAECPQELPDTFTRGVYTTDGMSLVVYVADGTLTCSLLKPQQKEIQYKSATEAPAGVALVVNGVPVATAAIQAALDALPATIPRDEHTVQQVVQRAINNELLRQKAMTVQITDEDVATARTQFLVQAGTTEAQLGSFLQEQGVTEAQLMQQLETQAQLAKLVQERLRTHDITISDDTARNYYVQNTNQFLQSEQAIMRHIFVSAEQTDWQERVVLIAQQLQERDFCDLVQTYSDDKKDDCGVYVIPRGVIDQNVEHAAFTTPANNTAVVQTEAGVHFVQTLDVIPTQVVPFTQIAETLQTSLANTVLQRRLNLFLQLLRADAEIVVYTG